MSFYNGLLNLTNWMGNVILPTLAGLFFAGAIYRFSRGMPHQNLSYGGLAALACSGRLRAMDKVPSQAAGSHPERCWVSILPVVEWVGNGLVPVYRPLQVCLAVAELG